VEGLPQPEVPRLAIIAVTRLSQGADLLGLLGGGRRRVEAGDAPRRWGGGGAAAAAAAAKVVESASASCILPASRRFYSWLPQVAAPSVAR
jgi:hypothetical protein